MEPKPQRKLATLNRLVSIAIILTTGILAYQLIRHSRQRSIPQLHLGSQLQIEGIDPGKYNRVLVLALSSKCEHCSESAPSYKRMLAALSSGPVTVKTVALLPQSVEQGTTYLDQLEMNVDDVRQADLIKMGIKAVPALLTINQQGVVDHVFSGAVQIEQQLALLEELETPFRNALPTSDNSLTVINSSVLENLLGNHPDVTLLDVSDREQYKQHHIPGAVNIPVDEIEARALEEISNDATVIVTGKDHDSVFAAANWLMMSRKINRLGVVVNDVVAKKP
jgi:rhodanese-related sulfurtransferase